MDIQIRKQLEQLEYIKDKLEYIEYDEALGCYIEKQDGLPTGVAAWVNGAFYGFEQAAKAQAVQEGFVLVEREKLAMIFETATNALVYHVAPPKHDALNIIQGIARKAMIEAQEPAND